MRDQARAPRKYELMTILHPDVAEESLPGELERISGELAVRFPDTNRAPLAAGEGPRRIVPVPYSQIEPGAGPRIVLIDRSP